MGWQTGQHNGHCNWSKAWQGRSAERLEELSECEQTMASQHWSHEGKRCGESKLPTFHLSRLVMICMQPDQYWHCTKTCHGAFAEMGQSAHVSFWLQRCHPEQTLKRWSGLPLEGISYLHVDQPQLLYASGGVHVEQLIELAHLWPTGERMYVSSNTNHHESFTPTV